MTEGERRHQQLTTAVETGHTALDSAQHQLDRRPDRREVTKIAIIAALAISVIMGAIAIAVSTAALNSSARLQASQEAAQRDSAANAKLAQQAYESAQEANKALASRGQTPVPVPPPSNGDPTDTIVAAATARVLASLPDIRPSSAALGQAVATYFMANPITPAGPTPAQLSRSIAGYFEDNPPPSGPPGENGQPGKDGANGKDAPPVTDADIQRSFVAYVQANPEFLPQQLCRNYGQSFNQAKDLTSADGTRYTLYGCITEIQPPAPTSSSIGVP